MSAEIVISTMTAGELQIALEWAAAEGWNPGLHDADCFFVADPNGFFAARLDGKIIAVISAVNYSPEFSFCGLFIVKPEYRKQGYAAKLAWAVARHSGNRTLGADGVLAMLDKYARLGFRLAHQNARYQLKHVPSNWSRHAQVITLADVSFSQLAAYDARYFPAPRGEFLARWISQADATALAFVQGEQIGGYGVIRKCIEGAKIGPLFAENAEIAREIFVALAASVASGPLFLDIPEPNLAAQALTQEFGMEKVFATARMYRNGIPELRLNNIYGISSFELG